MALRGDYMIIWAGIYSSGTAECAIAETTSVNIDRGVAFLETTSQDDGQSRSGIGGQKQGTISGDFLIASDMGQYKLLIEQMYDGVAVGFEHYNNTTRISSGTALITNVSGSGGNSDQLATGSYSMEILTDTLD